MLPLLAGILFVICSGSLTHAASYDEFYDEAKRCVEKCSIPYYGNLTTTWTNTPCRAWVQGDFKREIDLREMQNYCRNPQGHIKAMPWCYVHGQKWEYCFRQKCVDTNVHRSCGVPGFYHFNGSCHSILPIPTNNRIIAKEKCQSASAISFSSVTSSDEMRFLSGMTCLPVLLRGKYYSPENKWKVKGSATWAINEPSNDELPWCSDYPQNPSANRCLVLHGRCFKSVRCKYGDTEFHPACELDLNNSKFKAFDVEEEVTWTGARMKCERSGYELCNAADLCTSSERANDEKFQTFHLPLRGNRWMPVHDEYGDWIYVGQNLPHKQCSRRIDENGPLKESLANQGKVICCVKNSRTLPISKSTAVFVFSAHFDFSVRYRFSLSVDIPVEELEGEEVLWVKGQRNPGDLHSFNLMSHYLEGSYEIPVYFCAKNYTTSENWKTKLYTISKTPCPPPFKLQFYLFASKLSLNSKTLYVYNDNNGASKVTLGVISSVVENLQLNGVTRVTKAVNKTTDPCSGIQKIYDRNGIISAPRFSENSAVSSLRCKWRLVAPDKYVIRINFTKLRMPDSGSGHRYYAVVNQNERFRQSHGNLLFNHYQNCTDSYIRLRPTTGQRNTASWVVYGTVCGDTSPSSFVTIGNKLVVEFVTRNFSQSLHDFRLIFEMLAPPSGLQLIPLRGNDTTWLSAREQCTRRGLDLCLEQDICKYGGRPLYGIENDNMMVAVRDEFNEWLQIGSLLGQTCQRYSLQYGAPMWGISSQYCNEESRCSISRNIYCCRNPAGLQPPAFVVTVAVYRTVHNGIVFQTYVREGFDEIPPSPEWTRTILAYNDVTSFQLYHGYRPGFLRIVYFCFKVLNPPIGRMITVHTMSSYPCSNGWRLQFYLYGSRTNITGTVAFYAGMYNFVPQHSRLSYHHYQYNYRALNSFVVYGPAHEQVPALRDLQDVSALVKKCKNSGVVYLQTPATVVSPNYNLHYPPNLFCKWIIQRPAEYQGHETQLQLTIVDLTLESDTGCDNDFLEIHEVLVQNGGITELGRLQRLCGAVSSLTLKSQHSLLVKFKSDSSVENSGFKLNVEMVRSGCGGNITQNAAIVHSPGYPTNYEAGLTCDWWIRSPSNAYVIVVQFNKLTLVHSDGCGVDYVSVGPNASSNIAKFCQDVNRPTQVQVNDTVALVRFRTDPRQTHRLPLGKGFSMTVHFHLAPSNVTASRSPDCGQADFAPWSVNGTAQLKIIGGTTALPGSWPWVVDLEGATCGGSLVNNRWVVTAAHCVGPKFTSNLSSLRAVVGRHFRNQNSGEVKYKISKIVVHPLHGRRGSAGDIPINDIALLQLSTVVTFSSTIKPICLPDSDARVGEVCVIAGWGNEGVLSGYSFDHRNPLKYARVPILRNSLCNSWPKLQGNVKPGEICAGYPAGGIDSCWGDSGGPLMCSGTGRKFYLKGVVSWGKGCGKPLQPGIYVRVWSHYQWINDVMNGN